MQNIKIGEKDYILKLGVGACRRAESELGKSVFEALGSNAEGQISMPSLNDLVVLFWAALLINDKDLTLGRAEELMDEYFDGEDADMKTLLEKLVGSINFIKVQPNA